MNQGITTAHVFRQHLVMKVVHNPNRSTMCRKFLRLLVRHIDPKLIVIALQVHGSGYFQIVRGPADCEQIVLATHCRV
jgi:hypothetical protein